MASNASIWQGQSQLIPVANSFGNVFEEWQLAAAGQTLVIINSFQYTPGTFTLLVFKNGLFQRGGFDYLETNSSRVTFTAPLALNDRIAFFAFATSGVAIPNGGGVPTGGTVGQVLTKASLSDYDSIWTSLSAIASLLDSIRQNVNAAVTIDLTGAISTQTRNIQIVGTASVTGFQIANGQLWAVRAGATFTLVNSASLVTQSGANIICGAGDTFFLRATADNIVEILSFSKAINPGFVGTGYCVLTKSGANLLLSRLDGTTLPINGSAVTIPAAGVTLAPTALAINTNYYIYAYLNVGVLTLEPSTTGHSKDANTGIEIKTGDPTRTLVGWARTIAGPAWQDTSNQRFVVSWFNKRPISLRAASGVSANTLSLVGIELNAAYRCEWLHWAGEQPIFALSGYAANNTTPQTVVSSVYLDGVSALGSTTVTAASANAAGNVGMVTPIANSPAEGYHYVTFLANVSGGTGTWFADCFVSGQIRG